MSAEIVKQRKFATPKYVLAYFPEDEEMDIVPKEMIKNVEVLEKLSESNDSTKKFFVKAKFIVVKDGKKQEEFFEGEIIDVNGKLKSDQNIWLRKHLYTPVSVTRWEFFSYWG